MNIIEVKDLSFDYSDASVLRHISFSLESGDFLGIVGSNGTGKSTLIKLMLGLLPYQRGSIQILGQERKQARFFPEVGYVSQKAASFNTDFPATVREVVLANVYSQNGFFRRTGKQHEEKLKKVLKEVGMEGSERKLIGKLSGGQQQRIFIARALIADPQILFMDEPTVGVDGKSVEAITQLIRELNQRGLTILMTNHDTPSLVAQSNKLLLLDQNGAGELVEKKRLTKMQLERIFAGLEGGHFHA